MPDSKTIADIAEEWGFLKNRSSLVRSISVHGGWLSAALPVLFEAIELLKAEKVELIEERGVLKEKLQDIEDENAVLRDELADAKAQTQPES